MKKEVEERNTNYLSNIKKTFNRLTLMEWFQINLKNFNPLRHFTNRKLNLIRIFGSVSRTQIGIKVINYASKIDDCVKRYLRHTQLEPGQHQSRVKPLQGPELQRPVRLGIAQVQHHVKAQPRVRVKKCRNKHRPEQFYNLASPFIARKRFTDCYPQQTLHRRARVKPHPHPSRQRLQRLDVVQGPTSQRSSTPPVSIRMHSLRPSSFPLSL